MGKYRVIALSVGGLRNKVYSSGDEVTEDCFPEGNCPELVEKGFLEPIAEKEIPGPRVEKAPAPTPAKKTATKRKTRSSAKK